MKACIKNLFTRLGGASCVAWVPPALIAGLGLIPAGRLTAQTFTTVHSFTADDYNYSTGYYTNSDGANPYAGLILSGNTLYGTAKFGGSSGAGTVFKVNPDGTGFTNLHSFNGFGEGANPSGGLILSGNTLYGTATYGGSGGVGTVFAVNTDGTGFTNLYSFTGDNGGANPYAGLILSGNILYGTAYLGGGGGYGTVFKVNPDGTGFANLYSFTGSSDGGFPYAGLILSGNILYGTASRGGNSDKGTVFAVNTSGTGFTTLHSFSGGSDGAFPQAGLVLSGNTLYGAASQGGISAGTVFAVNTDGTGFTNLHTFNSGGDGAFPHAGLILSGNTLYGTTYDGGSSSYGTVFAVNTDGTGFTTLYAFTGDRDGGNPQAGLILSGNTLYGTAYNGSGQGNGMVFSLSLPLPPTPPPLTISLSEANVVLTWPTNAAGFTLQSTTNLVSPAIWSTVSPGPTVVNGQNAVTNPVSGTQNFYRLSQ